MEGDYSRKRFVLPIPLEELKYRLTRNKPIKMIEGRTSISEINPSRTIYTDSPTKDYVFRQEIHGAVEPELSQSFISEYLTPNQTIGKDESRVTSEIYMTPCESLQTSAKYDNKFSLKPGKPSININDDIKEDVTENVTKDLNLSSSSSQYASAFESSQFKNHQDKASPIQISNNYSEHEYLNNTKNIILVSSDDDCDDENNSKFSKDSIDGCVSKASCGNNIEINSNSSAIYISSDTESSFEEDVDRKSRLHEELQQLGLNHIKSPIFTKPCSELLLDDLNDCEVIADKSDTASASSSLQESFDYGLNDTLAEMEMALKYGLDYTMPDDKADANNINNNEECVASSTINSNEIIIETPSTSKPKPPSDKYKKTFIPVKNPLKTTQIITPVKHLPIKDNFNFKMPSKPGAFRKSPDFKSVVSPIAIYIKNSPKVPQVQHVPARQGTLRFATSNTRCNKENETLPFRAYKPAKRTIEEAAKEIKLPGTLLKYVPTTPCVTKHHGRMAQKVGNSADVQQKLLMEDLTICEGSSTFPDSSLSLQDVSYRTNKKTFIH